FNPPQSTFQSDFRAHWRSHPIRITMPVYAAGFAGSTPASPFFNSKDLNPMRVPLKLNAIEQEHLQELYDAAGVARDELPYSEQFDSLCQGFQDRTFKNAEKEQVFGAILKYVRSSSNSASGKTLESKVSEDQLKTLKSHLPRHARGSKLLPYSDE